MGDQFVEFGSVLRIATDPETNRNRSGGGVALGSELHRFDLVPEALSNLFRIRVRGTGKERDEFVAAVAHRGSRLAHRGSKGRGQLLKREVARLVTVGVVDLFEVIGLHHEQGERACGVVAIFSSSSAKNVVL